MIIKIHINVEITQGVTLFKCSVTNILQIYKFFN